MISNPKSKFKEYQGKTVMELEFDKICNNETIHTIIYNIALDSINLSWFSDINKVEFDMLPNEKGHLYEAQIKEREMTLEQIEKRLGYRIKIINK